LQQSCFFAKYARATRHGPASIGELAIVFQFNERTVCKTPLRHSEDSVALSLRTALDEDSEASILTSLLESFQCGEAVSCKELLQVVWKVYRASITKGWAHTFIEQSLDELQVCIPLPRVLIKKYTSR
jgi:hypothetical protein